MKLSQGPNCHSKLVQDYSNPLETKGAYQLPIYEQCIFLDIGPTLPLLKVKLFPSTFPSTCILIIERPFHILRYGHNCCGCESIGRQVVKQLHSNWTGSLHSISSLVSITVSIRNTINNIVIIGIMIIVISFQQTSTQYDISLVSGSKASSALSKSTCLLSPGSTQGTVVVGGNGLTFIREIERNWWWCWRRCQYLLYQSE